MDFEVPENMKCEVRVSLPYNTPVVGIEIDPSVRVRGNKSLQAPPHSLTFNWLREQATCSVHRVEIPTIQCMSCVTLKLPVEESYHCSKKCFLDDWKRHLVRHQHAAETFCKTYNGDGQASGKLRSCGSWPDFGYYGSSLDECSIMEEQEGKAVIKVGSSKTYVPSMDDFGFSLKLESRALDCSTNIALSPLSLTVTDPVIIAPTPLCRRMIQIGHLKKSRNFNFDAQFSNGGTFSVLSYNILSDLYASIASRDMYSYCPSWALAWEYRRKNLLHEIIGYDADILCLQEVQSDHFENFFKSELTKRGYSVSYKKKTKEVYTANQYIIDGCATFYRTDRFKEIEKYELEFDKTASALVHALEPGKRTQGCIRLMKGNVALVVILETLQNSSIHDTFHSRICVANTHIQANSKFPDAKLFQVSNLINELENIAQSRIPLLICGDMNSLPGSDPHNFLVTGKLNSIDKKAADPLDIYQHLKLHHSMPLVSAYSSLLQSGRVEEREKRKMNPQTKEPLFTNFNPGFLGTLDYVFYTEDSLKVEGLLELLDYDGVSTGIPSPLWSSDHIALLANFSFKPPSGEG